MTNKEKALRLSFLNFDGGSQNLQETRCITNSLPKSSLSQRKLKKDRMIFSSLSSRLRQARFSEGHNQIKPLMVEELVKNCGSTDRGFSFFQRNSSLACLRVNGTGIFLEAPEMNTERHCKRSKKSIRVIKKKKASKINLKFSSATELNHKPKIQFNQIHPPNPISKPKEANESLFTLYHKHLSPYQKFSSNPSSSNPEKAQKPHKPFVSPLLNLKKITIKGIVKNQTVAKTDQIDLKVNFDDLDISGWITNN